MNAETYPAVRSGALVASVSTLYPVLKCGVVEVHCAFGMSARKRVERFFDHPVAYHGSKTEYGLVAGIARIPYGLEQIQVSCCPGPVKRSATEIVVRAAALVAVTGGAIVVVHVNQNF